MTEHDRNRRLADEHAEVNEVVESTVAGLLARIAELEAEIEVLRAAPPAKEPSA